MALDSGACASTSAFSFEHSSSSLAAVAAQAQRKHGERGARARTLRRVPALAPLVLGQIAAFFVFELPSLVLLYLPLVRVYFVLFQSVFPWCVIFITWYPSVGRAGHNASCFGTISWKERTLNDGR